MVMGGGLGSGRLVREERVEKGASPSGWPSNRSRLGGREVTSGDRAYNDMSEVGLSRVVGLLPPPEPSCAWTHPRISEVSGEGNDGEDEDGGER